MAHNEIAAFLLAGLPYAWGMKALVFLGLSVTLVMQRPVSRLGIVINALFVATFLTSVWTSWLLAYLTRSTTGSEIDTVALWSLIVLGNIFPWIVNTFGVAVAYYTYKAEPIEGSDERDKRQEHTQVLLDETSLVLAKRGKKLSDAGISLDERIIKLGEDRRVADQREHAADQREHDADMRDKE